MEITCIMCPLGCRMTVLEESGNLIVKGNTCKRGELYAREEVVAPKRVITGLFTLSSGEVVSCKTNKTVDKKLIFGILKEIQRATKVAPVEIGDILIANVLGTGADIIATSAKG